MEYTTKTVLVRSKVPHVLKVGARKSFSNTTDLEFEFTPGEPVEMPEDIGRTFQKSMPWKYEIVDKNTTTEDFSEEAEIFGEGENAAVEFDPALFLEANEPLTLEAMLDLGKEQLFKLAAHVGASVKPNSKTETIANSILKVITSGRTE